MSQVKHVIEPNEQGDSVAQFLLQTSSYPERPSSVELRETHISWVFLTDKYAYKLKKPVKFDFLNFSTLKLRRLACEEELRLNRRLAADVYLEVVPVTRDETGRLALQREGETVDYVVKMRRLPDDQALDAMISTGGVQPADVRCLAERLTRFYTEQPSLSPRPEDYRGEIENHIRSNREALLAGSDEVADEIVKRVHTAQLRFLLTFPEVFDQRVCAGHLVEGHGDLRPEHIYLTPSPIIIDCIEFSAEFRRLDLLDELCFLSMECAQRGTGWIGEQVIEHYGQISGDQPPLNLRAFYTAYRACVRAKVSLLRASQLPVTARAEADELALRYLRMADEISRLLGPPSLIVVRGTSGAGKTTLAEPLSRMLGTEYLQTDAVRVDVIGQSVGTPRHHEDRYSTENRRRVYQAMFERAERFVARGLSVVLDGTFLTNELQQAAVDLATRWGARPLLVNCICPTETATQRIVQRLAVGGSLSEAQVTTHQQQLREEQAPPAALPQCFVHTTGELPTMTRVVFDALKSQIAT